jgi:DNA (cytosine-5)-methyltransferase 1
MQGDVMNYYNEHDPKAARWLRSLIAAGLIPKGHVDERSIKEVKAKDLEGFKQCHFFAGIGGWSRAFEIAGIASAENVWTGSCPCQSYSTAGNRRGDDDERNLWPEFSRLIRKCKPDTVFGEQVAAAIGFGWLDGICADLEGEDYSVGHAVLGAHSVGKEEWVEIVDEFTGETVWSGWVKIGPPHIRQRLFWVAESNGGDTSSEWKQRSGEYRQQQEDGGVGGLADSRRQLLSRAGQGGSRQLETQEWPQPMLDSQSCCVDGSLGNAGDQGLSPSKQQELPGAKQKQEGRATLQSGSSSIGGWSLADFITCRDGKTRRVGAGVRCLAHGVSGRVAQLRGLGNAIVPQVAAEFIRAFIEA